MKLPMVMPSNIKRVAAQLHLEYPGRIGMLLSQSAGWRDPDDMPYAIDNGRYSVWTNKKPWDEAGFYRILDLCKKQDHPPLWIAVPDVVTNAPATVIEYQKWGKLLQRQYGWPLAVVVQDGMTADDVLPLRPTPDVVFVGGSTKWKLQTMRCWCQNFPRVHIGRVNTPGRLWGVQYAGAESSDGTGYWRHERVIKLRRYLDRSQHGLGRYNQKGFGVFT